MDKSVHIKTAIGIKGSLMVCCFPPISPQYTDIPQRTLRIIFTDHVTWCILSVFELIAVLEWGRGLVGWGGLISNLNSVRLRFTAASWKKGYSCYISFFTNFALIYWTCLIGFGGKSQFV